MHVSFQREKSLILTTAVLKHLGAEMRPPLTSGSAKIKFLEFPELFDFICYLSLKYSSLDLTSVRKIEINFKFGLPKSVQ